MSYRASATPDADGVNALWQAHRLVSNYLNTVKRDMDALYESELAKGQFHDANQGPVDRLEGSTWLAAHAGATASGAVEEKLK